MIDLLNSAISDEKNKDYNFFLRGDLCQMSTQRQFLNNRGIITRQNNVYPCLKQSNVKTALELIFRNKVEGWWHYKKEYLELGISTEEKFNNDIKFDEL